MGISVKTRKAVLRGLHLARHRILGSVRHNGPKVGAEDHDVEVDCGISSAYLFSLDGIPAAMKALAAVCWGANSCKG